MSGHSKWAGIKHKKAIVDSRRGKLFTKLARAITVAAKEGGGDVEGNPALSLAVQKARDASMPKDNIERAIAKGTGEGADADALEAVTYEGYGPGGVAVLVEALTDNRNRTGSEMRHAFSKHGGSLGEPGSVSYLFDKKGVVVVDAERYSEDDLMVAIDAGAEDIAIDDDVYEVLCEPADLATVRRALVDAGVEVEEAQVMQRPKSLVPLDEDGATRLMRLIGRHGCRARELRRARGRPRAGRGLGPRAARSGVSYDTVRCNNGTSCGVPPGTRPRSSSWR
jgi:YebC/PmpR family DNA-binding regulatory protein